MWSECPIFTQAFPELADLWFLSPAPSLCPLMIRWSLICVLVQCSFCWRDPFCEGKAKAFLDPSAKNTTCLDKVFKKHLSSGWSSEWFSNWPRSHSSPLAKAEFAFGLKDLEFMWLIRILYYFPCIFYVFFFLIPKVTWYLMILVLFVKFPFWNLPITASIYWAIFELNIVLFCYLLEPSLYFDKCSNSRRYGVCRQSLGPSNFHLGENVFC